MALRDIWPGRRRGLDPAVHAGWEASLAADQVAAGRLLAWQRTVDGGYCLAAAGVLSLGPAEPGESGWRHIGWHRIERGGFDADTLTLRWTLYGDGPYGSNPADEQSAEHGSVRLQGAGRVPVVFRDQVAASIAVEQFIKLDADDAVDPSRRANEPGVIITGRRNLGLRDAPLEWRASLPRGSRWDIPGLRDLADRALVRFENEYDPHA
jgi:hypothetical protein